uniref:(northern house mosquito) hypothetical protein n=1 Tax=Culex pipiens TaxID=7175 RepID=A0A8D8CN21_CULPI
MKRKLERTTKIRLIAGVLLKSRMGFSSQKTAKESPISSGVLVQRNNSSLRHSRSSLRKSPPRDKTPRGTSTPPTRSTKQPNFRALVQRWRSLSSTDTNRPHW